MPLEKTLLRHQNEACKSMRTPHPYPTLHTTHRHMACPSPRLPSPATLLLLLLVYIVLQQAQAAFWDRGNNHGGKCRRFIPFPISPTAPLANLTNSPPSIPHPFLKLSRLVRSLPPPPPPPPPPHRDVLLRPSSAVVLRSISGPSTSTMSTKAAI
jgi:hypothetical protein